jgi:hypothetical protein
VATEEGKRGRQFRGRILYTSRKPERLGQERGREWWSMVVGANGWRTLHSQSEIDDSPSVLRYVTLTVDDHWSPRQAHVRIAVEGADVGSSWYRFEDGLGECEGYTVAEGRLSQRVKYDAPLRGLISHPIQADAWLCSAYPLEEGPGTRTMRFLTTSHDHRGATGPMLLRDVTDWSFVGRERIEVAAGTFDALHFYLGSDDTWAEGDVSHHPPYHIWCTADGNYIFLRAHVAGYMQTHYELEHLELR